MRRSLTVLAWIGVCIGAVVFFHALAGCGKKQPPVEKPAKVIVTGTSMLPTIPSGTVLDVEQTPFADLAVGDVVLRRASWSKNLVCHRVVSVYSDRVETRGDAAGVQTDPYWMTPEDYAGKVVLPTP